MKKNSVIILSIFFFMPLFIKGMERPPKHELAENEKLQSNGKKIRTENSLIMPEFGQLLVQDYHQLFVAVARGDFNMVRDLWPRVYAATNDGVHLLKDDASRCLLYFAIANNHPEVTIFLIQNLPVNLNCVPHELIVGLRQSSQEIISAFIEHMFSDFNEAHKRLATALLLDLEEAIENALDAGADVVGKCGDYEYYTPLHVAVFFRSLVGVRLLLERGCPLDTVNYQKNNALHWAILSGCEEIAEELLKRGAVPSERYHGYEGNESMLHVASRENYVRIVDLLLKHGAEKNIRNDAGRTPLHYAVFKSNSECVEILLNHGVEVNVCDHDGVTPLHAIFLRVGSRSLRVMRLLLEHGADVNARMMRTAHPGAHTPLNLALFLLMDSQSSSSGIWIALIEELFLWGAGIDEMDNEIVEKFACIFKNRPLFVAVITNDLDDLSTVLSNNPSIPEINEALVFAIAQQRSEFIEMLIDQGAHVYVGLEFLDRIFLRSHLTPQAKEAYQKIFNRLKERMSLRDVIIRRSELYEVMMDSPFLSCLPRELSEPLLRTILLKAITSRNRCLVQKALKAGANVALILAVVSTLNDDHELANLIIDYADRAGIPYVMPDWLKIPRARETFIRALQTGDIQGLRRALQLDADPNDCEGASPLVTAAFYHDAQLALEMVKALLAGGALIPEELLHRLDDLQKRPEIALLLTERARDLDMNFEEPAWVIEFQKKSVNVWIGNVIN
jgi:ankyrin repeat protein